MVVSYKIAFSGSRERQSAASIRAFEAGTAAKGASAALGIARTGEVGAILTKGTRFAVPAARVAGVVVVDVGRVVLAKAALATGGLVVAALAIGALVVDAFVSAAFVAALTGAFLTGAF